MTTEDVALNFTLAALIISANVLVAVALCYMRTAKRTTVVFLAQLALSNTVQGLIVFSRGLFFIYPHAQTAAGCLASVLVTMATTGHYVTSILYVYLDLYLSLKKMSVMKPVISTRLALVLSLLSAVVWVGLGGIGYGFLNPNWVLSPRGHCTFGIGQHLPSYIILIMVLFLVMFVVVFMCHLLTLRLMKQAFAQMGKGQAGTGGGGTSGPGVVKVVPAAGVDTVSGGLSGAQEPGDRRAAKKKSRWLNKNAEVMRMMLIILILFIICWYPIIILILVMNLCRGCIALIPPGVLYFTRALLVIQYVSNGLIYLVKIREFKNACKRICCFCIPKYRVNPQDQSENNSTLTNSVVSGT